MNETSRDRQREATRQRLYEAALGIFRRDGFRDARVDDITLVAGVSRTAFYFHFPTKEDVLTELMRRTEQPIADAVAMMPPQAELSAVLETVAELMNRAWQDERALIVDAMAIGMRIESSAFPKSPNGLRALLLNRFEAASKAGQLVESQKACLLVDLPAQLHGGDGGVGAGRRSQPARLVENGQPPLPRRGAAGLQELRFTRSRRFNALRLPRRSAFSLPRPPPLSCRLPARPGASSCACE